MRWLYTAFFVLIGWVLFDLTDFPSLCHALKLMFVPQATDWVAAAATNVSLLKAVVYLPLGIVCCLPLLRREPKSAKGILLANLASGLLLIVCIVFILSSSYNPPLLRRRKRQAGNEITRACQKSIFDKLSNETRFTGLSFERAAARGSARRARLRRTFRTFASRAVFSPTYTPPEKMISIFFAPAGANSARLF